MEGDSTTSRRPAQAASAARRLRWMAPIALLVTVLIIVALVIAVHQSEKMSGTTTIQSAGFYEPSTTAPGRFSLPVLQPGSTGSGPGGGTVTMASLVGKPVVLNMWSSTCTVCKTETPDMEKMSRRVGDAVRFVGVDTLDQKAAALGFLRRFDVTYLQLFDPDEHVGSDYDIPGLPVTIFVSARGKVVGEYLGALNTRTLTHYLTSLFGIRVPS